jgi:microcystin-dependent protein
MAYSYVLYTGNGSNRQFAVPFGYISQEHVRALVNGSPVTFTWINSGLIQLDVAPANGAAVRVYRQTPLTEPLVDFTDGSTPVAADFDTNAKQSIYTQQELDDSLVEGLAGVIPNGDKGDITTSVGGTVWTIDNQAVTSAKIADGTIVDGDISATAEIAGTKVAFAPYGTVASTNVQAAIQELDDTITALPPPVDPTPAGTVTWTARTTAPTGYLKANGAAVSRTTYSALFAAIGTTYGVGDNSTTFNLPDLRGEFARGWDDGRGIDTGRAMGSSQAQNYQSHTHSVSDPGHTHGQTGEFIVNGGGIQVSGPAGHHMNGGGYIYSNTTGISIAANGGTETRPRNIALLVCIKH